MIIILYHITFWEKLIFLGFCIILLYTDNGLMLSRVQMIESRNNIHRVQTTLRDKIVHV